MKPIAEIIVASTYDGAPVKASDLKAQGAMAMFLKDDELDRIDMAALEAGIPNLEKHVENMLSFGVLGT
jgi:formyltetrahydrofolate synthetase